MQIANEKRIVNWVLPEKIPNIVYWVKKVKSIEAPKFPERKKKERIRPMLKKKGRIQFLCKNTQNWAGRM